MSDKLICVSYVAKRLSCTRQHVYNLIRDGKLEAVRIGVRGVRVKASSFLKFTSSRQIDPKSYDV